MSSELPKDEQVRTEYTLRKQDEVSRATNPNGNVFAAALDEVLKATAAADADVSSEGSDDLALLQNVARQHSSATLGEATKMMVIAIYRDRYPSIDKNAGLEEMASEIAAVIMDSPTTKDRVEAFWSRLRESVS